MLEAQLDAYKGVTKNIYNGSKKDQKMHVEDIESPSEIFLHQEISMFWNKRSMWFLSRQKISIIVSLIFHILGTKKS